jgi:tRNA threonylcarbamoyladenosine biosynthesis protein TsaE
LAEGLACPDEVSSPTFVIVNEYEGRLPVQHVDLYRLEDEASVESLGPRELFWSDGVTVVEWSERAGSLLPDDRLDVVFSFLPGNLRSLTLTATGPRSEALLAAVLSAGEGDGPCAS